MCFFFIVFFCSVFHLMPLFYLRYISPTNGTLIFLHENAHSRSTRVAHRVVALTDGKNTYPEFYSYYSFFSTMVFYFWSSTDSGIKFTYFTENYFSFLRYVYTVHFQIKTSPPEVHLLFIHLGYLFIIIPPNHPLPNMIWFYVQCTCILGTKKRKC